MPQKGVRKRGYAKGGTQKGVRKRGRSHFFCFGHLLVTIFVTFLAFLVTFLPVLFCLPPFAAGDKLFCGPKWGPFLCSFPGNGHINFFLGPKVGFLCGWGAKRFVLKTFLCFFCPLPKMPLAHWFRCPTTSKAAF